MHQASGVVQLRRALPRPPAVRRSARRRRAAGRGPRRRCRRAADPTGPRPGPAPASTADSSGPSRRRTTGRSPRRRRRPSIGASAFSVNDGSEVSQVVAGYHSSWNADRRPAGVARQLRDHRREVAARRIARDGKPCPGRRRARRRARPPIALRPTRRRRRPGRDARAPAGSPPTPRARPRRPRGCVPRRRRCRGRRPTHPPPWMNTTTGGGVAVGLRRPVHPDRDRARRSVDGAVLDAQFGVHRPARQVAEPLPRRLGASVGCQLERHGFQYLLQDGVEGRWLGSSATDMATPYARGAEPGCCGWRPRSSAPATACF